MCFKNVFLDGYAVLRRVHSVKWKLVGGLVTPINSYVPISLFVINIFFFTRQKISFNYTREKINIFFRKKLKLVHYFVTRKNKTCNFNQLKFTTFIISNDLIIFIFHFGNCNYCNIFSPTRRIINLIVF